MHTFQNNLCEIDILGLSNPVFRLLLKFLIDQTKKSDARPTLHMTFSALISDINHSDKPTLRLVPPEQFCEHKSISREGKDNDARLFPDKVAKYQPPCFSAFMKKKRTIHEVAFRLSYDMRTHISPKLGHVGMNLAPQQLRAMRLIWSQENTTLVDLSKTLKRDKGQVTRIIDELVKAGMVKREPNPADKRSKLLKLTEKGYGTFEAIEQVEADFSDELIKGIKKEHLDIFFFVSDQLSKNMKDIND